MANSDVIITRAGQIQPAILPAETLRVFKGMALGMCVDGNGNLDTPTDQRAWVSAALAAFAGISDGQLDTVETAIWWQAAVGLNAGADQAVNTILGGANAYQALDGPTMRRVNLYLIGKFIGALI